MLNDRPFVITRTKTKSKGALVFHFDGQDLTTQSMKDTQAVMDECLGVAPQLVARTMFHGQFAMNGLLEATDIKFKEELSLLVPLSLWQQGATTARAKSREAANKSAEYEGMIRLRSSDVEELRHRRDEAEWSLATKQFQFDDASKLVKEELKELGEAPQVDYDVETIRNEFDSIVSKIDNLETKLNDLKVKQKMALSEIEERKLEAENHYSVHQLELQTMLMAYDQAVLELENVNSQRKELRMKWNYDLSNSTNGNVAPLRVCPTCQQPISSSGHGHSHAEMQRIAEQEISSVRKRFDIATVTLAKASSDKDAAIAVSSEATSTVEQVREDLERIRMDWAMKIAKVEHELQRSRTEQASLMEQLAGAAKAMQQEAIIQSKKAVLLEEEKAVRASQVAFQDICTSVEAAEARLQDLRALGEAERSLSVTMTNLVNIFGPRGVQTYLLQNAINSLQTVSQMYLDELSDGTQRLELSLDAGDRISRTAMIRRSDGSFVERPLSSLSGGQWRRCSLALSLGFAQLVSAKGRFQSSLTVLDEPLTHLDRSGRSRVGRLLRSLLQSRSNESAPLSLFGGMNVSTILVILQDLAAEELEESFDHIDEVIKANGISTVSIDEQT